MDEAELMAALLLLARLDHFDESRRAAELLPVDLPLHAVLRASDGVQQLARALDVRKRRAQGVADAARSDVHDTKSLYR